MGCGLDSGSAYIDCPGESGDKYMTKGSTAAGGSCDRACKAWWAADGWGTAECKNSCSSSGDWDDWYVPCLQRNLRYRRSNIDVNTVCETSGGCQDQCNRDDQKTWICYPQCERCPVLPPARGSVHIPSP